MKFELTADQRDFMASLDRAITAADPVAANRAWAEGVTAPGLALAEQIAALGVSGLMIPEQSGGVGATAVEMVCAFEVLGRHAVPGPWVESAAFLATALTDERLSSVADGSLATVAASSPWAVDADVADAVYVVRGDTLHTATVGSAVSSVDSSRRLFTVEPDTTVGSADLNHAHDIAALAAAAELLGAGERVLADAVEYVKQRTQFGRPIGSYQAIKHQLANVRIALDFARPLVHGAAVDPTPRAISAAKVQAGDAADLAARVGLQVHGAIGYTAEYDLSRHILRIRALNHAWGTRSAHRARLLDLLTAAS